MIIHRFKFLQPVAFPGRAPLTEWDPAGHGNDGTTVRYDATLGGWLFTGPRGKLDGLSTGGRRELTAIGADDADLALGVFVPAAIVVLSIVDDGSADALCETVAPSKAFREAIAKPAPAPVATTSTDPAPPPVAIAPAPPQASRRRGPVAPAPPPPPSVGWVDE